MQETHFRTCNLCEAMCGLKISLENNVVIKIEGDKEDTFSRGHICPKAAALKDVYEDPDRLKRPLKKTEDGKWQEISWEEGYQLAIENIKRVQTTYGNNAVGIYQGNPSVHNLGTMLFASDFFKKLDTKNNFTATSTDQLPHHFASWLMFGHPLLVPIPDIDRTDFMVIIGGNPLASNGSMMSVPDVGNRLKAIQERGGKFVVIDPRRTETAQKASQHLYIRPSTDAFLLLALLHEILKTKPSETPEITILKEITAAYSPTSVASITGISAADIEALAHEFTTAKSAVCYGRMGVSVQTFGGLCQWLINVLNVVTGNLDRKGGAMFTLPAIDLVGNAKPRNRFKRWNSRVRNLPEFIGELPVVCLAEEIMTEGEGQIKLMITSCGNPVLSIPNGKQLETAFEKLDYMISFDIYLNETTRHANLILPPATGLETSHYDLTFHHLAVRNTTKYSAALFPKTEGAKYDWEIFQELKNLFLNENNDLVTPEMKLDLALRFGPYKLTLDEVKNAPHGIDLGELKSQFPARLATENKEINLCPEPFLEDMKRLKAWKNTFSEAENTFWLIGRRHLRDNNSWLHNSEKLMKGKNRCTLLMHPNDAFEQNLEENTNVKVISRVGEVMLPIEFSENMMRGVVSMPHGYGHNRKGVQLGTATQYSGVSINDLTDETLTDELTGNAAFSNVKVHIKAS